jgi:tetratricopeptide (TPR) repeat protein/CHAT domain-containing protein
MHFDAPAALKRITIAAALGAGLLFSADSISLAQRVDEANELNRRVIELYNTGQYSDAIPIAQRVLAILEEVLGNNHPDVAASLNNLAALYQRQGRYADAEPLYQRALAICERALGRDHPDVATSLNSLAGLYDKQGRYADAEPLFRRALAIQEMALGRDHPEVAISLNNLASLYDNQGRYADAEPFYQRALAILEKALGRDHPDVATLLNNLAALYDNQGRYADAEPFYQRALAILEKALGRDHPDVATSLNNLAALYDNQGRYADAGPLYQRALAILEKALGRDHPDVATALNNLAVLYQRQGRYAEAEPLYQRALAIREKELGRDHPDVATSLINLAWLYDSQGRYADAEPLFQRALAIREKALGRDHPDVAAPLSNLAELYRNQGRYADAEPLFQRALAIREKALGRDHPAIATSLNSLAALYQSQGRYADAEPLYEHALAIREKALGRDHPDVAASLSNLAFLYQRQGRYANAEPLYQRGLAIQEKALGPDHPDVAASLNNLALLYVSQGRYAEAGPLYQRGLAIQEEAFGRDHPDVARSLNNLAALYQRQDRYADAEPLYQRALAIQEKALGRDHPDVAVSVNNLALLYDNQGRYADAEPLFRRALAIREKALGRDHPEVATALNNLAALYAAQGRHADAEPLLERALAIREKALGGDHPDVANLLAGVAFLYSRQNQWAQAADILRRSTSIIARRTQRGTQDLGRPQTGQRRTEAERASFQFESLVKAAYRLALNGQNQDKNLLRETFEAAQWAVASEAAKSLAQMAARSAAKDPALAARVRKRQDLVQEWQERDRERSAAVSKPPDKRSPKIEADNVSRLAAIDAEIAKIDKRLRGDFPEYAVVASPTPLSLRDVQAQLDASEALVLFLDTPEREPTPEETFIWVVTKTESRWVRAEMGTKALASEVAALRCGLDKSAWEITSRCSAVLGISYTPAETTLFRHGLAPLPFNFARAHELYKALFGQIEDLIADKQLLIIPSGPLTQLPFHVLVTEPPAAPASYSADYLRDAAWLTRKHAITVLPAVSSLRHLRAFAKASHADEPLIGFGNPLLNGASEKDCAAVKLEQVASQVDRGGKIAAIANGQRSFVDVDVIRRYTPLPETADELCAVARDLGIDPAIHLHLGAKATEADVKRLSHEGTLAKYRIVAFATHGAVAGELSKGSEPGLILTPPDKDKESEIDDSYLSASEIAGLKLDADWVILSACNTAAGGAENAEALSGLARAFIYAGARSLLVSHWYVNTNAAVQLITKAVRELKDNPTIGRSEAMRRSMLSLISQGKPGQAHPSFWAPFIVVGEGTR